MSTKRTKKKTDEQPDRDTGPDIDPPEVDPSATAGSVEEGAAVQTPEDRLEEPAAEDDLLADVAAATRQAVADSVESLRTQRDQANDRALRLQAELENYRKRAARQMQDERRYANLPLMRDLLPVIDNMQRAIEAAEQTHDTADLLQGVKMVAQQLEGVLEKHHCRKIEALNEPFDPHVHEAISQQPSQEHPENTVLLVTQTGFQLHDRVVRPSQVIVSKPSE